MNIKIFQIPAAPESPELESLNRFLRGYPILDVQKQLTQVGSSWHWQVWVEYQQGTSKSSSPEERRQNAQKEKEKLLERLGETGWELYEKLRTWRNLTAKQAGIPNYNVLKNEHLALLVEMKDPSLSKIQDIQEIGPKRVEKYGEAVLRLLKDQHSENKTKTAVFF